MPGWLSFWGACLRRSATRSFLVDIEGLSTKDMASTLEINVNTATSRLRLGQTGSRRRWSAARPKASGKENAVDAEGRELLDGFARAQAPSAARQAQAWSAIEGRIALGDAGPPVSDGGASAGAWGRVALAVLVGGAVVLAVFGVSTTGGAPASSASPMLSPVVLPSAPPVSEQTPETLKPLQASRSGDLVPQEREQAVPAPKPGPAARAPVHPRHKQPAVTSPAQPPSSSLAEEMKLLRRTCPGGCEPGIFKALVTLRRSTIAGFLTGRSPPSGRFGGPRFTASEATPVQRAGS